MRNICSFSSHISSTCICVRNFRYELYIIFSFHHFVHTTLSCLIIISLIYSMKCIFCIYFNITLLVWYCWVSRAGFAPQDAMTRNTFCITGPLWGESKGQKYGALMLSLLPVWISCWTNSQEHVTVWFEMPWCLCDSNMMRHPIACPWGPNIE